MVCPGWQYTHSDTLNKQPEGFNIYKAFNVFIFLSNNKITDKILLHQGKRKYSKAQRFFLLLLVSISCQREKKNRAHAVSTHGCENQREMQSLSSWHLSSWIQDFALTKLSLPQRQRGRSLPPRSSVIAHSFHLQYCHLGDSWQNPQAREWYTSLPREQKVPHLTGKRWNGGQECHLTYSFVSFIRLSLPLLLSLGDMELVIYEWGRCHFTTHDYIPYSNL